jgi:hypothetical protein
MLDAGTSRLPDEIIGICPPCEGELTVEKAAIAAVMAGAEPRQFNVILAAAEAMLDKQFNLHGVSCTTMGATPIVVVNGPARHQAGLNFKAGAMGSGSRANAAVGRALKLMIQNVGGSQLGGTESTTLGTPMKFGLCIAEWEEYCEEWQPLHASSHQHEATASAVSLFACMSGPHQIIDPEIGLAGTPQQNAEDLMRLLARGMHTAYCGIAPLINDCVLVVSPEHYNTLVSGGVKSKAQLQRRLWDLCNLDMSMEMGTIIAAKSGLGILGQGLGMGISMINRLQGMVTGQGLSVLPKFEKPESIHIVVAGGTAGKFSAFMPCFGVLREGPTAHLSRPVSRTVNSSPAVDNTAPTTTTAAPAAAAAGTVLLDPTSGPAKPFKLASRSSSGELLGRIALLSISKRGSDVLLDRLEQLLKLRFPSAEIQRISKPTFSRPAPLDVIERIVKGAEGFLPCMHVVAALAD